MIARHVTGNAVLQGAGNIGRYEPWLIIDQHGADFTGIELKRYYMSSIHGITLTG